MQLTLDVWMEVTHCTQWLLMRYCEGPRLCTWWKMQLVTVVAFFCPNCHKRDTTCSPIDSKENHTFKPIQTYICSPSNCIQVTHFDGLHPDVRVTRSLLVSKLNFSFTHVFCLARFAGISCQASPQWGDGICRA